MTNEKKGATPDQAAPLNVKNTHRHDTKIARVIAALKHPKGLNRFEAERIGEHCLNSTVSRLGREGYVIAAEWERVKSRFSADGARVKRYRLIELRGAQ